MHEQVQVLCCFSIRHHGPSDMTGTRRQCSGTGVDHGVMPSPGGVQKDSPPGSALCPGEGMEGPVGALKTICQASSQQPAYQQMIFNAGAGTPLAEA